LSSPVNNSLNYLQEYCRDLFASQYVGNYSNLYVTYLSGGSSRYGSSHPATVNRSKLVSDILDGSSNMVVKSISDAKLKITGTTLQLRSEVVKSEDFFQLNDPIEADERGKTSEAVTEVNMPL